MGALWAWICSIETWLATTVGGAAFAGALYLFRRWYEGPNPKLSLEQSIPTHPAQKRGLVLVLYNDSTRPTYLVDIWMETDSGRIHRFALTDRNQKICAETGAIRVRLKPLDYEWSADFKTIVATFSPPLKRRLSIPRDRKLIAADERQTG